LAGQLLLGIEEVEQIARIEIAHAATARQRARERDEDGSCDQTLRAAHGRFPLSSFCVSSWRPAAARPAALRHASAGSVVFHRHWQSSPAIAASPQHHWRAMPTAPAIRARYGGRWPPAQPQPRAALSSWDSWWFPGAAERRESAP